MAFGNDICLNIKPLSVNECWQGRRFKTRKYINYEAAVIAMLPKISLKTNEKISLEIAAFVSNSNADLDNLLKPIIDILQKRYGFNDRLIYELKITKHLVNKGKEGFKIKIINV